MTGFIDRINSYFCKFIHWGGKMKKERIQIKQRGVYIAILIVMAVAIGLTIRMAFRLNVLRDAFVMANSVLGIAVLMLGMALMANIAFSGNQDAKFARVFTLMTITDFLSIFCDVFTYEAYGLAEFSGSARVMCILSYFGQYCTFCFLSSFLRPIFPSEKNGRLQAASLFRAPLYSCLSYFLSPKTMSGQCG